MDQGPIIINGGKGLWPQKAWVYSEHYEFAYVFKEHSCKGMI